jgi:hypothetical protein
MCDQKGVRDWGLGTEERGKASPVGGFMPPNLCVEKETKNCWENQKAPPTKCPYFNPAVYTLGYSSPQPPAPSPGEPPALKLIVSRPGFCASETKIFNILVFMEVPSALSNTQV